MLQNFPQGINTAFNKIAGLAKKPDRTYEIRINELKSNIEDTKAELKLAMENFNNVVEPKLIDFYIYKIQSEQTRYDQLISEYKSMEIASVE